MPAAWHPRLMEPLLPKAREARLSELTCEVLKAAGCLTGQVHSRVVLDRLADLVREMNCYYSNLIEGHKTAPREIERALKRYFQFQALHLQRYREELMRIVRALVDEGEIPRARVQVITGKGATVSAEIIKRGLEEGVFESPSPKGPLRPAFPAAVQEFYFPQLFLDLPVEPDSEPAS